MTASNPSDTAESSGVHDFRGVFEVKGSNRAFDAPGRMLAVYVETDAERTIIFRSRENPAVAICILAGFRELCASGLVMHLHRVLAHPRRPRAGADR